MVFEVLIGWPKGWLDICQALPRQGPAFAAACVEHRLEELLGPGDPVIGTFRG